MRYANMIRPNGEGIRDILPSDEATILRLADNAPFVHLHPDYSTFEDWLASPAALIQTRDDSVRGLLVAHFDPPPIAWLRVVVVDQHEAAYPLRKLIAAARERLQDTDAQLLACLSSGRWLDEELPQFGFTVGQEIMGMEWEPSFRPQSHKARRSVSKPNLTIRKVHAGDFAKLVEIEHAAFDDPLWWSSQKQMERAAQGAVNFDVVELDGEMVGFTFGAWTGRREAHIVRIAVVPTARGRGIGAALLDNALRQYEAESFQYVTLNTQVDNAVAHRLYERFGFKTTGDRFSIWVLPVE